MWFFSSKTPDTKLLVAKKPFIQLWFKELFIIIFKEWMHFDDQTFKNKSLPSSLFLKPHLRQVTIYS